MVSSVRLRGICGVSMETHSKVLCAPITLHFMVDQAIVYKQLDVHCDFMSCYGNPLYCTARHQVRPILLNIMVITERVSLLSIKPQ